MQAPPPPSKPPVGIQTSQLKPAAPAGGAPLPKATVKLKQTQPLSKPPGAAPRGAAAPVTAAGTTDFSQAPVSDRPMIPIAIVMLVFSLAVLGVQLWTYLSE